MPSISILEQYDSNVFFAPKSQLSGKKPDDLITTITPQINLSQRSSQVTMNLSLGAVVQKFANNSELDNFGFNAAAGIDFSRAVSNVLPRMKMARIYGTYQFTPSASAFGAGGLGGGIGGGTFGSGGIGVTGPIDSGLVTRRIRTSLYNVGAATSYALSPTTDFQTSYGYSQISFGGNLAPTTTSTGQAVNTVFDTHTHTISAGPTMRISGADTVSFKYTFTQTSQASFGDFTFHTGTLGWGRNWTREMSSSVNGGLQLIEPTPDATAVGGQRRVPATMLPTGGFTVTYASGSSFLRRLGSEIQEATGGSSSGAMSGGFLPILPGMNMPGGIAAPGSYRVTLGYNLGVYPSFVQTAGPIYTHLVALTSAAGITDRLTAQAGFNFAHSSFTADTVGTTFNSYGTTVGLNYLITPTFTAFLTHRWLQFDNNVTAVGAGDLSFSKQVVLLGLTYAYAPRGDFFRSGAFWEGASSESSGAGSGSGTNSPGGVDLKK
ncbi:MAG: hypothetical protein KF814_14420 [Nitrospiraceae bacterium]|nr:hypothetical protein [Nitrospiraceae bacterium]